MLPYKLPNAAANNITVTSTATGLLDLINTAASTTLGFPHNLNCVELTIEDGDIRMTENGTDPTSSVGKLLSQGGNYVMENLIPKDIRLIRTGASNVKVSVRIGWFKS